MALAVLIISCFVLYASSRYFPLQEIPPISRNRIALVVIGSVLSLLSIYLFTFTYTFSTSLMYWMIAVMTIMSALILSIKLNTRWIWVWGGLCVFFILIDIL